jgi:trehalose/maltose hydrolase-like predicted phosphorylase
MKKYVINEYSPEFPSAYLANGLIGFRFGKVPFLNASVLVNGYSGATPGQSVEGYAQAPNPIGADISIGRNKLSNHPDKVIFREQTYDFSNGELETRFDYVSSEATIKVHVLTFCCRTAPTLAMQEITVEVDKPCNLTLSSVLDATKIPGKSLHRSMFNKKADAILLWESDGGISKLGAGFLAEFIGSDIQGTMGDYIGCETGPQFKHFNIKAQPGQQYKMRQVGCLIPGIMHTEPHWQVARMIEAGIWQGWDKLREDNRNAWAELWKGRIKLIGADNRWQEVTDAAYYYLHTSIHAASPCSIAPFGLSERPTYYGHIFWDTETFMYPPVLLTSPNAARSMLDYRLRMLPAARNNAAMHGYSGAMYPWQSDLSGGEVTPLFAGGCAGVAEQHVNLDIAYAFAQYVHATGDELFLRQQAWPVISAVVEWLTSRVTKTTRGYELRHITGVDEGIDNIHNNGFTNILAVMVLREAIAFARKLGAEPPQLWCDIEKYLFIPIEKEVILKHDSYVYEGGLCCPETLLGFFPFGYTHSPAVDSATYQYYLDLAHTFIGGAMLSSLCGVWAARAGDRKLSLKTFEAGMLTQIKQPYDQFTEFTGGEDTIFLTNMAGFLMALQYGLTGLTLDSGPIEGWCKHPIVMPEGWEGIEIDRIWAKGRPAKLTAYQGQERAELKYLE